MSNIFEYGLSYIQVGFRDSNGYFKGQQSVPDTVANNTTSHSYMCFNPVTFEHAQPTNTEWTDFGGQNIRGQKRGGVESLGSGTFTLSEYDTTFAAMINATAIDTTSVTDWKMTPSNTNATTIPAMFLIESRKGMIPDDVTGTITDKWSHWVYPNVQISVAPASASQAGGVNPNPTSFTYTPNFSNRRLDGRTFLAANTTVVGGKDMRYHYETDYPIAATMYTKDAVTTTFILGYRPKASIASGAADNSITNNGTTLVVTSVSTSTGVVTLAVAGTAAHIVVAVYETEFVAI